jgi:hypothetical protein
MMDYGILDPYERNVAEDRGSSKKTPAVAGLSLTLPKKTSVKSS